MNYSRSLQELPEDNMTVKTVDIKGELISTGIHFYVFRPDINNKDCWIPKRYTEYNHNNRTLNMPIHVASKYGLAGQSKLFVVPEGLEWRMEDKS